MPFARKVDESDDVLSLVRPPSEVMRLERLGSIHPSRLSFARTLIRRMHKERWRFEISHHGLDESGFGTLVYAIHTPQGPLSFVAFSTPLAARDRTDRVIAEKWDMSFTLFNGLASRSDVKRLFDEVPKQEAGRMSDRQIVLSRANKSVRLFEEISHSLAAGQQPDPQRIASIGYLVRTTAVYGNGKFGLMDFNQVKCDTPFELPFQAEMLTVFMARQFSFEVLNQVVRGLDRGRAIPLCRTIQRSLGVGNATGLGMAPFLIGHPQLIHQWLYTREIAIARVKSLTSVTEETVVQFGKLLLRVMAHLGQWKTGDSRQSKRLKTLKKEVELLIRSEHFLNGTDYPWCTFSEWVSANMSTECLELFNSVMLELYPDLVNELEQFMGIDEWNHIDPSESVELMRLHLERHYDWALKVDFSDPDSQYLFWYISVEKEEPRVGHRYHEPGSELEMRIGVARYVKDLYRDLCQFDEQDDQMSIAEFLIEHPNHRYIISRVQSLLDFPYAEIQDNLLAADCLPLDLLRCKLALFGATRFDPKSNLWTRITLFQGAPLADELERIDVDDWAFPSVEVG